MTSYQSVQGLEQVVLEASYVLDVLATPTLLTFQLDAFLTPQHPDYVTPSKDEQERYRPAILTFSKLNKLIWDFKTVSPAVDASGEIDYGSIDSMTITGQTYTIEGDFGRIEVNAKEAKFSIS